MSVSVGDAAPHLVLQDQVNEAMTLPVAGHPTVIVFYRGDFCPYCNGQLALYARNFAPFDEAGAAVCGVSVDPPDRNAAMVSKLMLPFSLLSDPDGFASRTFDVWNDEQGEAHPAIFITDPAGILRYVYRGKDFTDRPGDAEVFDILKVIRREQVDAIARARP